MAFIEITGVEKTFGATRALAGVDVELGQGEVHGLLGENGAGKSTLMKVLAGVVTPDAGRVCIDGVELQLGRPTASRAAGLGIAYQELSSPLNVDIATKLCWPDLSRGALGLVSRRRMQTRAQQMLTEYDAGSIDPSAQIGDVDLATRQRVEIVAAVSRRPKLLVLDEPTAALPDSEWLFGIVRSLASSGTSVIYISHKLPEIEETCDRGTVLRSGSTVGSFERGTADETELIELMIGRSFEQSFPDVREPERQSPQRVLTVESLGVGGALHEASLYVDRGEIVGLAGLEGQGQRELVYALAGQRRHRAGRISVDQGDAAVPTALVPEERKTEGLFPEMSSAFNLTVGTLGQVAVGPLVSTGKEREAAGATAKRVNLPAPMLGKKVATLSGGNQQKVVLGRAIARDPACLLLFDPTRGVDAATKFELYELTRRFADQDRGVLLYSTEIPELVGLCDRVYVLADGRVTAELVGDDINESAVMRAALAWKETSV